MSRPPSPAVLELLRFGIQPAELARDLGISRQAVSYQLTGKTAELSSELRLAIAKRASGEVADRVAQLIAEERDRRTP